MKRVIVFFLLGFLLAGIFSANIYAADMKTSTPMQRKIIVYSKPDVTVTLNNSKQIFYDSKGNLVYPIIYNGSTYLPVRSASVLMKESIEWDGASKTIFIGKTLSNPNKTNNDNTNLLVNNEANETVSSTPKPSMVNAYLKPDVLVMHDFVLLTFRDATGNQVYPIIYNGTTYLPIRAISELMEATIDWDGATQTVSIGDEEALPQTGVTVHDITPAAKSLKKLFEREEVLYYEATAKTTSLKEALSLSEKQIIAETITENYMNAQNLTAEIKTVDTTDYTKEEAAVYEKLSTFAESTEYYILVLENIAYLAAQDSDYSMLAETFLYFAMDSQSKMEEARVLMQALNE